jgi:hypothetical protein
MSPRKDESWKIIGAFVIVCALLNRGGLCAVS